MAEKSNFRNKFESQLNQLIIDSHLPIHNEVDYQRIIREVREANSKIKKISLDYRRVKKYNIMTIGETTRLISKKKSARNEEIYFASSNEVFDILYDAHQATGHGGVHKMRDKLKNKWANISRTVTLLFLKNCETCVKKRCHPKKGLVVKPILSEDTFERGQVDLIDFQTCKDGEWKFVFNYQDHFTKFVVLRPLKTKTAAEVAHNLVDVFCLLSAPLLLHSDNGREFVNQIVGELTLMWPGLKLLRGKPRHS